MFPDMTLLEVENLSIGYQTRNRMFTAVEGISFAVERGESLGFVGESGCGKTTVGMGLLRLLPDNAVILGGAIRFKGRDLVPIPEEEMRLVRWKQIAMIFQAAMNALNPVQRVDAQIAEAIMTHDPGFTIAAALKQVAELFDIVDIPAARMHDYPHQYSGGMRQRAIIAMALACRPALIIADEPTTALDVIVQDQILEAIRTLQKEMNIGIIFISHDIAVVADVCHHIAVMYAGQIVEYGRREEVFSQPVHPYTKILLASHLTLTDNAAEPLLVPETAASGHLPPCGCPFCDRCPEKAGQCRMEPLEWTQITPTHRVFCRHAAKE